MAPSLLGVRSALERAAAGLAWPIVFGMGRAWVWQDRPTAPLASRVEAPKGLDQKPSGGEVWPGARGFHLP